MTDQQLCQAERDLRTLARLGNQTAARIAALRALRTAPPRGKSEKPR